MEKRIPDLSALWAAVIEDENSGLSDRMPDDIIKMVLEKCRESRILRALDCMRLGLYAGLE